jgi:uncharacterized protein with HEPN domain
MPSSSERDPRLYVEDMLAFCERALSYVNGMNQSTWVADGMRYDATLRNLEMIGEAAKCVSEDVRATTSEVPWRQLIATRNRLIHAYLGIDDDIVWSIVTDDLPALRQALIEMLKP